MASVLSLWPCARDMAGWGFPDCQTYQDEAAFSEFYAEYFPTAVRRVKWHDDEDEPTAEDIVQEAFVYLWRCVATFVGEYDAFCATFWKAVRFRVFTARHQHKRHVAKSVPLQHLHMRPGSTDEVDHSAFLHSTYNVERQVLARAELQAAAEALQRVAPETRRMLLLDVQGYTYAEMMERCGIPAFTTFQSRLQRARQQLRREARQGRVERKPQWSRKHAACIECGKTDQPHAGSGYCERCAKRHQLERRAEREARALLAGVLMAPCVECGTTVPGFRVRERCKKCYRRWRHIHDSEAKGVAEVVASVPV